MSRRVPGQRHDCDLQPRSEVTDSLVPPQVAQASSSVMASQVRPGSTQPIFLQGPQQSVQLIGRRPAYSIRARGLEPQTEAGCMAAISSCDPEAQKTFGKRGRPCMEEGQVPHPENPCPHRQRQNRLPAQGHERHQQEPRDGVYRGPAGEEFMQVGCGNCGESGPKRSGQGRSEQVHSRPRLVRVPAPIGIQAPMGRWNSHRGTPSTHQSTMSTLWLCERCESTHAGEIPLRGMPT
jgi:hypothetical protein